MTTLDSSKTVRELAVEIPSATRVFQKHGIDFCCGGHKSLAQACDSAHLPAQTVIDDLLAAEADRFARSENYKDWSREPLADLIDQIVNKHHAYVRSESPRLNALAAKVAGKHGPNHPELASVQVAVESLMEELRLHMMKEEQVLFPYIHRMEEAVISGEPVPPPPFGQVERPVAMMMQEHENAGELLRQMRELTGNFEAPEDACMSFRMLYQGIVDFETDLHQHIHLENNILFPRALQMEGNRHAGVVTECAPGRCCVEQ